MQSRFSEPGRSWGSELSSISNISGIEDVSTVSGASEEQPASKPWRQLLKITLTDKSAEKWADTIRALDALEFVRWAKADGVKKNVSLISNIVFVLAVKKDREYTTEDFPGLNVTSVSAASVFDCPDGEIPKLRWDYGYNPAFPFMLKNDCDYDDIIIYSSIGTLNQSDDIVMEDVSGDKEVSTSDALAIFQVVVGKTDFASAKQYIAANVDFDDEPSYFWIPTSKDALKALQIAVGEIKPNRIKPI